MVGSPRDYVGPIAVCSLIWWSAVLIRLRILVQYDDVCDLDVELRDPGGAARGDLDRALPQIKNQYVGKP